MSVLRFHASGTHTIQSSPARCTQDTTRRSSELRCYSAVQAGSRKVVTSAQSGRTSGTSSSRPLNYGSSVRRRLHTTAAASSQSTQTEQSLDSESSQDLQDVQDILETMELLKQRRMMNLQEVRLVLMIEDPREAERRRQLGVESESGCSRDEIAAAFMEVMEDRVPADRMTLRKLAQEMRDWPRLREESETALLEARQAGRYDSPYARVTNVGLPDDKRPARPSMGADWDAATDAATAATVAAKDNEKDLGETLPSWVGYGVLYGISFIPIVIGVLVVIILFVNSLQ